MYGGQEGFQKFLLVIALLCVPVLLFGKPYLIYKQRMLAHQKVCTATFEDWRHSVFFLLIFKVTITTILVPWLDE